MISCACFLLPITFPIAYCLLPVAYCLLPVACCLLPFQLHIACCLLPVACCLLPVACCILLCQLPIACCLPAEASSAARSEGGPIELSHHFSWKYKRKHAPISHFTLHIQAAAITYNEVVTQHQAKTSSCFICRALRAIILVLK